MAVLYSSDYLILWLFLVASSRTRINVQMQFKDGFAVHKMELLVDCSWFSPFKKFMIDFSLHSFFILILFLKQIFV